MPLVDLYQPHSIAEAPLRDFPIYPFAAARGFGSTRAAFLPQSPTRPLPYPLTPNTIGKSTIERTKTTAIESTSNMAPAVSMSFELTAPEP